MDTFEDLMQALESYSDAKAAYNKAQEESYFSAGEREALDRAKKLLKEALDGYIRQVVAMREIA